MIELFQLANGWNKSQKYALAIFNTEVILNQQEVYYEKEYFGDISFTRIVALERMQFRSYNLFASCRAWFGASSMVKW